MALLGSTFVADEVEDLSYSPIPAGIYTMQIVKSEMKPTKAGTGEYLSLQMTVLDEGPYQNRTVYELLNLVNPNEKAVAIARSTLKNICKALGLSSVEDTNELHGIPFKALVKIEPGSGGYDDSNKVKKYLPLDSEMTSDADNNEPW